MNTDLQRASMWKRISAWLFDSILLVTVAVLFGLLLSSTLGFNGYYDRLSKAYETYESRYGIDFEITQEAYDGMTEQEKNDYKTLYDQAYEALTADEDAMYVYGMVVNLSMLILSISILLAVLAMEFIIPLCFRNGQTLGKKIFSIGVMRTDSIQLTTVQLFVRTILGKYAVETMVPVFVLILLFLGAMDVLGLAILAGLLVAQLICLAATRERKAMHDLLSGTVVVDIASQRIFRSSQDLIDHTKKVHAERAARQDS